MKLKLFIGAEYRDIDHKYIRESRNPLEEKINQYIQDKHYNIELHDLGYVMVLMPKEDRETNYKEVIRYFKKNQTYRFSFTS